MSSSASSDHHPDFANTRWSLVMQLDAPCAPGTPNALAELCLGYWYPVYAYVRRCGHVPETAQDITRAFLQHLIQQSREGMRPASKERFRDFLLTRLHAFLAGDWRELAHDGEVPEGPTCADLEARNQRDNADAGPPGDAYQRSFATEVIARAFRRLRAEAAGNGHLDMYEAMEPFLSREPGPGVYEELASTLGSRPLALVVALKRLRQRFRELVGKELSDTVDSFGDLVDEQKTLHDFLRPPN